LPRSLIRPRIAELLDFVQLAERATDKVDRLSGGMKRSLTIARALINEPELLLLDEPTTGLDPQARHLLWDRLFRLKQRGVTLIITTHYMDEAEQLCDRLVVMDGGRIAAEGSPRELITTLLVPGGDRAALPTRGAGRPRWAGSTGWAPGVEVLPDRLLLYSEDAEATVGRGHRPRLQPVSVVARRSTLEDVFLRLTGRTLVD
jgi:lipooligosaccharide transport system ATP-binding protein